jgi:hypothetical protein
VRHGRHYTIEEANGSLPWLASCLERLRSARAKLSDREAREALGEAAPGNGGGTPGRTVSEAFIELRDLIGELGERDIVLRDLDRGLVDFPSLRGGQEVYLCWEEGETEIGFWHEPDAGFAGRRPLGDG